MRIQHNIAALSAYRNLTNNNSMVSKNLEKLSSGYRINRAGDDAAGLAISEKMRAQITGLETAQKNASDGISLIQTAEGALTEVHSMLNRMVELANQSANGTYQDEDRVSLQSEITALKDEINRISKSTNFNGRTLLNGDLAIEGAKAASSSTKVTGADVFGTNDANTQIQVQAIKDGEIGKDTQKLKFTLSLTDLKISNTSTDATSSINGEDISITIGTGANAITLKAGDATALITKGGKIEAADLAAAIAKTNGTVTIANASKMTKPNGDVAKTVFPEAEFTVTADGDKLIFEMKEDPTADFMADLNAELKVDPAKATYIENQANGIDVKINQDTVYGEGRKMAQGRFDIGTVEDGYTLKIGDDTYLFAVGDDSKFKNVSNIEGLGKVNVIDLSDIDETDTEALNRAAMVRLSQQDNSKFEIGIQYSTDAGGVTSTTKIKF